MTRQEHLQIADPAQPSLSWATPLDGLPLLHPTAAGWSLEAEGRHWELFTDLARGVSEPAPVDRRLQELAALEAAIVEALPFAPRMH